MARVAGVLGCWNEMGLASILGAVAGSPRRSDAKDDGLIILGNLVLERKLGATKMLQEWAAT